MSTGQDVATIPEVNIVPLDISKIPEIISRYLNGETLEEISGSHNWPRATMMYFVLSEIGAEKWMDIKTQVLTRRVAEADGALEGAKTIPEIRRAEALCKFARLDLERRRPALYGQKREITEKKKLSVYVNRDGKIQEQLPPVQGGEVVDIRARAS